MLKKSISVLFLIVFLASCTSQKKLAYLNNLSGTGGAETFTMEIPEYKLQPRDVLYITVKAMTPDGTINDFLTSTRTYGGSYIGQAEGTGYIYGYDVTRRGRLFCQLLVK